MLSFVVLTFLRKAASQFDRTGCWLTGSSSFPSFFLLFPSVHYISFHDNLAYCGGWLGSNDKLARVKDRDQSLCQARRGDIRFSYVRLMVCFDRALLGCFPGPALTARQGFCLSDRFCLYTSRKYSTQYRAQSDTTLGVLFKLFANTRTLSQLISCKLLFPLSRALHHTVFLFTV